MQKTAYEMRIIDWSSDVCSSDLEGLPKTGFGRIAVLEAAMTEDKPVLWAIRADGKPAIALAAPARAGETLAGIALVRLPLARVTPGLQDAALPAASYLALRTGSFTLLERGAA